MYYSKKDIGESRLKKWEKDGTIYYSVDDLPKWLVERLVAHSHYGLYDRMVDIVIDVNRHCSGGGKFSIVGKMTYFNAGGLEILVEYFIKRNYLLDTEVAKFIDEVSSKNTLQYFMAKL